MQVLYRKLQSNWPPNGFTIRSAQISAGMERFYQQTFKWRLGYDLVARTVPYQVCNIRTAIVKMEARGAAGRETPHATLKRKIDKT